MTRTTEERWVYSTRTRTNEANQRMKTGCKSVVDSLIETHVEMVDTHAKKMNCKELLS